MYDINCLPNVRGGREAQWHKTYRTIDISANNGGVNIVKHQLNQRTALPAYAAMVLVCWNMGVEIFKVAVRGAGGMGPEWQFPN